MRVSPVSLFLSVHNAAIIADNIIKAVDMHSSNCRQLLCCLVIFGVLTCRAGRKFPFGSSRDPERKRRYLKILILPMSKQVRDSRQYIWRVPVLDLESVLCHAGAQVHSVSLSSSLYDANAQNLNLTDLSAEKAVSLLCSRCAILHSELWPCSWQKGTRNNCAHE